MIKYYVTVQPRVLRLLQSPYECVNGTKNPEADCYSIIVYDMKRTLGAERNRGFQL